MKYSFFVIPIKNVGEAERELNAFLSTHRVLTVHREFVSSGENSFWSLAVECLDGTAEPRPGQRGGRIDYKEVLNEEDFSVFTKLRETRRKLAEQESVPVYAILTNEQLAEIARRRPSSKTGLLEIEGLGEAKAGKYGAVMLEALRGITSGPPAAAAPPADGMPF